MHGYQTHPSISLVFDADAKRNKTKWWQEITQRLPVGGLLITDMGFYGFEWFDACNNIASKLCNAALVVR